MEYQIANYFQVFSGSYKPYFDEGPQPPRPITDSSNGAMDTSLVDTFRQGIEIAQLKYYDAGLVKIHASEPNHLLNKRTIGQQESHIFGDSKFQEIDYFDPVKYIQIQSGSTPIEDLMTFPIIINNSDPDIISMNGVIEPLTIRAIVSFASIDSPETHSVKGNVMNGNTDFMGYTDQVVTQYTIGIDNPIPYIDDTDMFNNQIPVGGYFSLDKTLLKPFDDRTYVRDLEVEYEPDMELALRSLNTVSNNCILIGKKSSTTGWQYDNIAGTDSIAFGGMTY